MYLSVIVCSFNMNELNEMLNMTLELMSYILILIYLYVALCYFVMNESIEMINMTLELIPFDLNLLIYYSFHLC